MSLLKCNCFKAPPSPDVSPVQLHDVSREGRRFTMSTQFTTDTLSDEGELRAPPHDVFESTNTSYNPITPHSAQFLLRGRHSLHRIHHAAAKKLRDKASCDSTEHGLRKQKPSDDQIKSDLTETRSVVQDKDAEMLKTPASTLRRSDSQRSGSIRISPEALRRIINRSVSPSPQPRAETSAESYIRSSPTQVKRRVLTRMLTERFAQVDAANAGPDEKAGPGEPEKASSLELGESPKKYVFSDITTPEHLRSASSPESIKSLSQQASDVKQRRFSTMSACMPGSDRYRNAAPDVPKGDEAAGNKADMNYPPLSTNNADRPSWMRGASGVFAESRRTSIRSKQGSNCTPQDHGNDLEGVDGIHSGQHTRSQSDGSTFANSMHLYNMGISRQLASSGPLLSAAASSPELRSMSTSTSGGSYADNSKYYSTLTTRGASRSNSGISSSQIPTAWASPKRRLASSFYSSRSRQVSLPESRRFSAQDLSSLEQHSDLPPPVQAVIGSLQTSDRASLQRATSTVSDAGQVKRFQRPLDVPKRRMQIHGNGVQRSHSLPSEEARSTARGRMQDTNGRTGTRYLSRADIEDLSAEIAMRRTPSARFAGRFDGSNEASVLLAAPVAVDFAGPSSSWSAHSTTGPRRRVSIEPAKPSSSWSAHPWARPAGDSGDRSMSPRRRPSVMALGAVGTSAWDKALQEHAREDAKIRGRRPGSVSHDELRRHSTLESLTSLSSIRFRENSNGQDRYNLQSHPDRHDTQRLPMQRRTPASHRPVSTSSINSWTRFPSHTRRQRIDAPAGEDDHVFSRDFAPIHAPARSVVSTSRSLPSMSISKHRFVSNSSPLSKKKLQSAATRLKVGIRKTHSGNHLVKLKSSLRDFSRTKGNELRSMLAVDDARGHRSSVSEGALKTEVKYPELEMLSPVISSRGAEVEGDYFPSFEDYLVRDAATEIAKIDWGRGGQKQWVGRGGPGVEDVSPGAAMERKEGLKKDGEELGGLVGDRAERRDDFELALPLQNQGKGFELSLPSPEKAKESALPLPEEKSGEEFRLALSTQDQGKGFALSLPPQKKNQESELSLPQRKKSKKTLGALYPSFIPLNAPPSHDPNAGTAGFELTLPTKRKSRGVGECDYPTDKTTTTMATVHNNTTTATKPIVPGDSVQAFQLTLPHPTGNKAVKSRRESDGVVQARIQQFDSNKIGAPNPSGGVTPFSTTTTTTPQTSDLNPGVVPKYDSLSFSRTRRDRSSTTTTTARDFSGSEYSGTAHYARALSCQIHRDLERDRVGRAGAVDGGGGIEPGSSLDGSASVKSSEIPVGWRHILPKSLAVGSPGLEGWERAVGDGEGGKGKGVERET